MSAVDATLDSITSELLTEITNIRVRTPERLQELAGTRSRRKVLTEDGRLNIIAADHTARGIVAAGAQKQAMADRHELLTRIGRILLAGTADGVMATIDVIEELLLLSDLLRVKLGQKTGFMDEKLAIASLNRGGLAGTAWEMDDPVTGASPEQVARMNLDGIKLLLRVCDTDAGSLRTITYCTETITRANASSLPIFLEPLPVVERGGKFFVVSEPEQLAKLIGIATALGDSSRNLWLKLPLCPDFDIAAKATTCPILALGGDQIALPELCSQLQSALAISHNLRGSMIGRNILFPQEGDCVEAARRIHALVHGE